MFLTKFSQEAYVPITMTIEGLFWVSSIARSKGFHEKKRLAVALPVTNIAVRQLVNINIQGVRMVSDTWRLFLWSSL